MNVKAYNKDRDKTTVLLKLKEAADGVDLCVCDENGEIPERSVILTITTTGKLRILRGLRQGANLQINAMSKIVIDEIDK